MGAPTTVDRVTERGSLARVTPTDIRLEVRAFTKQTCAQIQGAWQSLMEHSDDPNPFFGPAMLPHALALTPAQADAILVTVWHGADLIGVIPLQKATRFGRFRATHFESMNWRHRYRADPICHRDYGEAVVIALLGWLDQAATNAHFLSFPQLPNASFFGQSLCAHMPTNQNQRNQRRLAVINTVERAAIQGYKSPSTPDFDAYLRERHSPGTMKKLRAKRRKLQAMGTLNHETLSALKDLPEWLDNFFALEHQSWKGDGGTSIFSDPHDVEFFQKMATDIMNTDDLVMTRYVLTTDKDKIILATSIDIRQGAQQFALKMAHHRDFARYSPGVLHEIENLRQIWPSLHGAIDQRQLVHLDSCATAGHRVLDQLYRDKVGFDHLIVGRNRVFSKALLSAIMAATRLARKISAQGSSDQSQTA